MKKNKSNIKKRIGWKIVSIAVITAGVLVATPFLQPNYTALADEYDDKIAALQEDIARYQAEQEALNAQAVTLQATLNQLASEQAALQAEINLSQAKHDKLVLEIAETEKKISDNQDALGQTLADLYVDDDITPIEVLASSESIGDYIDKQEYRNSIRDQLTDKIAEVKQLKSDLEDQKEEVAKILEDQKEQKAILVAKRNEQQTILNQTKGDEARYQQLISASEDEIEEARAIQAAIQARLNSTGGYVLVDSGLLNEYPWNESNCPMWWYFSTGGVDGDGHDGHGYGCRQCASYVAWRIAKETGYYYSWGNAVDFTWNAKNAGYKEGAPHAGSIAVMDPAKAGQNYGHVVWVEAVDGDQVLVSQYNYNYGSGYGLYSKMWLSVNAFDHYIRIK